MKKEKIAYDQWILFFQCYVEFLRYHFYNKPPLIVNRYIKSRGSSLLTGKETLLTGVYEHYAPVEMKIKSFLEREYQNVIKEYSEKLNEGDKKNISIIVNALGKEAFDEKWFIEGMKNLYCAGKAFQIPHYIPELNFTPELKEKSKTEKRAKKSSLSLAFGYYENPNTMKTRYHRGSHRKQKIFCLHFLYRSLHKPQHKYVLTEIQPYTSLKKFEKDISKVEKVLKNLP